jgi:hypothetical protein
MSVTGRFRSDLINAAISGREAPPTGGIAGSPATPYSNWLERMQRSRGRHAAITKNLYTWSSYKNWTEKVRENWSEPPAKPRNDGRPR